MDAYSVTLYIEKVVLCYFIVKFAYPVLLTFKTITFIIIIGQDFIIYENNNAWR